MKILKWYKAKKDKMQKEKELIENFRVSAPLTWWINDLTHRTCGLVDHPTIGLRNIPWPDCDHVYIAIDKKHYDKIHYRYKECIEALREGCLVYDQHVPSGASSFRVEADSLIKEFEKTSRADLKEQND